MRKTLEVIAGAALAASCGLAAAQITPATPSYPTTGSPSLQTDPNAPSPNAATSTSSSVSASGGPGFAKLDANHDGTVSKKEAASNTKLTAKWDTLDTNKDGKLDQGEFAQFETGASNDTTTPRY